MCMLAVLLKKNQFFIVRTAEDIDSADEQFHPEFVHQHFGEKYACLK